MKPVRHESTPDPGPGVPKPSGTTRRVHINSARHDFYDRLRDEFESVYQKHHPTRTRTRNLSIEHVGGLMTTMMAIAISISRDDPKAAMVLARAGLGANEEPEGTDEDIETLMDVFVSYIEEQVQLSMPKGEAH